MNSFFVEDDMYDPVQTISAYRKLTKQKQVELLIVFGTMQVQAIGALAERDRIPLINLNFEARSVVGKEFLIRSLNHTDQYMSALGQYLLQQKIKSIPILQTESTFMSAMVDSLKKTASSSINFDVKENILPTENDFKTTILKLKQAEAKIVGLFLFPEQLITFLRQARDLKYAPKFFGTDLCETAANLANDPSLLSGCIYPDNSASPKFRKDYSEKYGNTAQLTFAASAYDMTLQIAETLKTKDIADSRKFMQELAQVKNHKGVLGEYSYQQEPEAGMFFEYPIYLKEIRGKTGTLVIQTD